MKYTHFLIAILLVTTAACYQKKPKRFLVFAGTPISVDTSKVGRVASNRFVKSKYKILEKTYGDFKSDTIEFSAFVDELKFLKFKTVLLFVYGSEGRFYKLADPWNDVYQTIDNHWGKRSKMVGLYNLSDHY